MSEDDRPPDRSQTASAPGDETDDVDGGDPTDDERASPESTGEASRSANLRTEGGERSGQPPAAIDGRELDELVTDVRTIDGRIRWKWILRSVVVAAIVGAIVGGISAFGLERGPVPGIAAFALVAVLSVGHVALLYRSWQYEIRSDALFLQRGVFTHVKTIVPFVRVQHIDTSRGPIDRVIGLSSLVVYTAGSRGADVTIPGLTPDEAEDLQDRLKVLAKGSNGDDAV